MGRQFHRQALSSKTMTSGFHIQPSSPAHLFVTGAFSAKEPPGSPDQARQAMGRGENTASLGGKGRWAGNLERHVVPEEEPRTL